VIHFVAMKYCITAIVLSAWILLCGFQQPSSPQGKANQKTTNAAHANTNTAQPNALPSPPSSASNADAQANGIESHGKQNIQVVSAAPEKSVDLVERVINIIGIVCTIALTGVGIYGIFIVLRTLGEMQRQREEMARQVQAAMLQLRTMNEQLSEMSQQTASLKEYVDETKKIAKSTADSVQIIINKERARIRIEVSEDPILPDGDHPINELKFKIFCDGSTPAFILKSSANLKVTDSKNPSTPHPNNIPMGQLPTVMHPGIEGMERTAIIWQHFEQALEPQLLSEKLFLHFYGVIEYTDAFEISRSTRFRYLWAISDSRFYGGRHGYWIKNGGEEENSAN
jgi:hypothetical protein